MYTVYDNGRYCNCYVVYNAYLIACAVCTYIMMEENVTVMRLQCISYYFFKLCMANYLLIHFARIICICPFCTDILLIVHLCTGLFLMVHFCTYIFLMVHFCTHIFLMAHFCTYIFLMVHFCPYIFLTLHFCPNIFPVVYLFSSKSM